MTGASPQPNPYQVLLDSFTSEELSLVAQVKRFFEWYRGDPDFKAQVDAGSIAPENVARLRRIGVTFDLAEVGFLWEAPEVWEDFIRTGFSSMSMQDDLPDDVARAVGQYPLLELWGRFFRPFFARFYASRRNILEIPEVEPLNLWRHRQVAAARSELGYFGYQISYPLLAFELSDGCSIGCWFCGFATRKLRKVCDYSEHGGLFRQVVQTCVELFGKDQANSALLYYGTEPHDNPGYMEFMQDFEDITGKPPCTSTAVTTDTEWLRGLIAFYRRGPYAWPRLSVLSRTMMFKIHDLYSPDELRDVELLMQMRESRRKKVASGRILREKSGLRGRDPDQYFDEIVPQGSIACVSGFLVNMARGTIQLISPCYTSNKWPLGYRVFDEQEFSDAGSFRRAVEQLIDDNMHNALRSERVIGFRDDLYYRLTDQGFVLTSPNQVHHFKGGTPFKILGNAIAAGEKTFDELCDLIFDASDVNPIAGITVVNKLYENGFLNEVIGHRQVHGHG